MHYKSKKWGGFRWLHILHNVFRASFFLLGLSQTENVGMWAVSLTHAGYVEHSVYSQDHFVTNSECPGCGGWVTELLSVWAGHLVSHSVHWLHVCRDHSCFSQLFQERKLPSALAQHHLLVPENLHGSSPAASVKSDHCLTIPDTRGALFLVVIAKCLEG